MSWSNIFLLQNRTLKYRSNGVFEQKSIILARSIIGEDKYSKIIYIKYLKCSDDPQNVIIPNNNPDVENIITVTLIYSCKCSRYCLNVLVTECNSHKPYYIKHKVMLLHI